MKIKKNRKSINYPFSLQLFLTIVHFSLLLWFPLYLLLLLLLLLLHCWLACQPLPQPSFRRQPSQPSQPFLLFLSEFSLQLLFFCVLFLLFPFFSFLPFLLSLFVSSPPLINRIIKKKIISQFQIDFQLRLYYNLPFLSLVLLSFFSLQLELLLFCALLPIPLPS